MPIIANATTSVDVMKTLGEITGLLVTAGAQAIMTEYENNMPASVSFRLLRPGDPQPLHFRLPADWRGVQSILKKASPRSQSAWNNEQSQRVAWRIIRDWTRAQIALTQAGCAKLEQVMLPYLFDPTTNETLYQRLESVRFSLPPPKTGE